jgi:hypothetical protein
MENDEIMSLSPTHPSEIIAQFLALVRENGGRYAGSLERIKQHDARTQDILHDIELNEHTDEELLALTRELVTVRRERRIDKDAFEIAEKIKLCMDRQDVMATIKTFERMLGEVRKVESYHAKRTYRKKVEVVPHAVIENGRANASATGRCRTA